jgi:hypothetical protein
MSNKCVFQNGYFKIFISEVGERQKEIDRLKESDSRVVDQNKELIKYQSHLIR